MYTNEPLFLKPIYKNAIWGREIWKLSAHENGITYLINDPSVSLLDLFNNPILKEKIFGKKCVNTDKFPILVKFIYADKDLSVQVHPNDEYARLYENSQGKNEAWYIMNCNDDASIIYGLTEKTKDMNNEDIVKDIKNYLNYQSIHENDFISIPSGTVHAILAGTSLCEIQQNSDITYRIYDWDRVDNTGNKRPLHIEKSIDVINKNIDKNIVNCNDKINENIYSSNSFCIDIIEINNVKKCISNLDSFVIYVIIDGKGIIKTKTYVKTIQKESVFLIPASLGEYEIIGNMKLLKIYL